MLDRALELYFEKEDYFSALHLAGAAEELLGKCLERKGVSTSLQSDAEGVYSNKKTFW